MVVIDNSNSNQKLCDAILKVSRGLEKYQFQHFQAQATSEAVLHNYVLLNENSDKTYFHD